MRKYLLKHVLLDSGWARDMVCLLGDSGEILALERADTQTGEAFGATHGGVEAVDGIVIPGMPNAHSHAFQRAMAGATEYRESRDDSFWTWRRAMYALANRVSAEDLRAIATQLFIEMLKGGYTGVAEFHYLHQQIGGSPYAHVNTLYEAIDAAADAAGIGLTLLPTLYQHSDFGRAPLRAEQARFGLDLKEFLRRIEMRARPADARADAHGSVAPGGTGTPQPSFARNRTGAAFHSLRAVDIVTLREAHAQLMRIDPSMPIHIHVSEQLREVHRCRKHTGQRPIEWLLNSGVVDEHWCLVHATHADAEELQGVVRSRAVICLCPSTEGNLGDGLFNAQGYLQQSGRLCIGSDSEITVDPSEELRWLEYQHRLRRRRRAVLAAEDSPHIGTRLWREAAKGGAQALGQPTGALAVGRRADWLVLDPGHPSLQGGPVETALDRLVFASAGAAIRDVMVAGRWVIRDYRHALQDRAAADFAAAIKSIGVPNGARD